MKLSEKLEDYRADRPDEWTMDEFTRNAKALELVLEEVLETIKPTYILSQEGRDYVKKIESALGRN